MAAWRIRHRDEDDAAGFFGLSRATGDAALARDLVELAAAGLIDLDPEPDGTWRVGVSDGGAAAPEDVWDGGLGTRFPPFSAVFAASTPMRCLLTGRTVILRANLGFELDDALMDDRPRDTLHPAFDAKPAIDLPDARPVPGDAAACERTPRDHQVSCDNGPGARARPTNLAHAHGGARGRALRPSAERHSPATGHAVQQGEVFWVPKQLARQPKSTKPERPWLVVAADAAQAHLAPVRAAVRPPRLVVDAAETDLPERTNLTSP